MVKWFLTTLITGILPMALRIFVYFLLDNKSSFHFITISDTVLCGFVFNISIFNEREWLFRYNPVTSSASSKISIALIILFTFLFTCSLINERQMLFKEENLICVSAFLDIFSFIACIVYMITCFPKKEKQMSKGTTKSKGAD